MMKYSTSDNNQSQQISQFISLIAERYRCKYIISIGCRMINSIISLYPKFDIIGIDDSKIINQLKNEYDFGNWIIHDFNKEGDLQINEEILNASIIICDNLMDRLEDPKNLLINIKDFMKSCPCCILTKHTNQILTDHDAITKLIIEFEKKIVDNNLNVFFSGLSSNSNEEKIIMTILGRYELKKIRKSMPDNFRVLAIMTSYNEEDIIENTIQNLTSNGIDVYLIDNWSTDKTLDIAMNFYGKGLVGIEKYPPAGPSQTYDWSKLLKRVEEVSQKIPADWYIHHDSDEIRYAPWNNVTLKEGIFLADVEGFNAIDHTLIVFPPIDNNFTSSEKLEKYFKYFEFGKNPGHFKQIKAWKNLRQRISLSKSGGHEIEFDERKIYPYKFLLKHYPIRSQKHGEKKIFTERKNRWNAEERDIGWHTHYDSIVEGHSFLRDSKTLTLFDSTIFYRIYLIERLSGIGVIR